VSETDLPEAAIRARISGRVQGVSYRAWTRGQARALGLTGWVRNEPDGAVSALFAGPPAGLDTMREALYRGPLHARVDRVETSPTDPAEAPPDFRILR